MASTRTIGNVGHAGRIVSALRRRPAVGSVRQSRQAEQTVGHFNHANPSIGGSVMRVNPRLILPTQDDSAGPRKR